MISNSKIIIKLIQLGGCFHVVAQGFSGKIYHLKFPNEQEAREWLAINTDLSINIKLERI